jgi:hypothetical protein
VPSGLAYRVESPAANALVTPALARELCRVLERFAREAGASERRPVGIGFRPGIFGHHKVHRAADIYTVGGVTMAQWKKQSDRALARACATDALSVRRALLARERRSNLGWRLYKTLQSYGRWSHPRGYPVQLFGPWTRREGPWTRISDFLLHAHRDHIHVAR